MTLVIQHHFPLNVMGYDEENFTEEVDAGKEHSMVDWTRIVLQGICLAIFGILGLIGNSSAVAYFSIGKKYKRAFESFMLWLAFFDNIFIIVCLLLYAIPEYLNYNEIDSTEYNAYLIPWLVPIGQVATSCNILFTIAISHERYKVVCNPLQHRARSAQFSSTHILRIIAFSLIYNSSKFFEWKTVVFDDENDGKVSTVCWTDTFHTFCSRTSNV